MVQSRVTRLSWVGATGRDDGTLRFQRWCKSGSDRKDLAIQALAGSGTVSDLAARHGVSRKFIYQQTHKARIALADAFSPVVSDDEVLFELAVTKGWLHHMIIALTLICRSAYRGGVEFLRDVLCLPFSLGCVHDVLQAATRQASAINRDQDRRCCMDPRMALRAVQRCWMGCTEAALPPMRSDVRRLIARGVSKPAHV